MPRALDLAAWLADELGGRIARTDLRTGFWFRRTHKVVARSDGVSFEAYVSAAAVWLWIQNLELDAATKFSVNRRSVGMECIEPLADAFAQLQLPVFVPPRDRDPLQHSRQQVRDACRSLEDFIAAIELQRGEYLVATAAQVTIWNQRPGADRLRARIHAVKSRFGGRIMA